MNFRTTLFLLFLVLLGGGVVAVLHFREDKAKPADITADQHKLLDFDAADVTHLVITNSDDKRTVFDKSGADWKLVEPVPAAAKTFEVDDLLRALVALQTRGQVDAEKKASGGLDHPSFVVELTTKSKKTTKLSFGDKSTFGDSLYVLVNDNDKPDVVSNSIYATLDKPTSNYRDTKLVSVDTNQIKQLVLTNKGKTIRLEKQGDNWQITEPANMPAETSAVGDVLVGITTLNATRFIDSPGPASKYSLNHPRTTVSFTTAAPATQPAATQPATDLPGGTTIRFGGYEDILKANQYASVNENEVAIVPATVEKVFIRAPLDLRNKDVAAIEPDKVSTFTISINRPATTQPTTRPAELREFAIERRKEQPQILGPALPPGVVIPTTQPTTAPSTEPSVATTQPSAPATQPAVAAATQPAVPPSKWFFASGGAGDAEEGQVNALLETFRAFRAVKYIEPAAFTGDTYVLTLHAIPRKAGESPADYTFTFIDLGTRVLGKYKDLEFEVDRSVLEKLTGDFKTPKPPAPPPPTFQGAGGPGGPGGFPGE